MASVLRALRHSNQQGNEGVSMDGQQQNSQFSGSTVTNDGSVKAPKQPHAATQYVRVTDDLEGDADQKPTPFELLGLEVALAMQYDKLRERVNFSGPLVESTLSRLSETEDMLYVVQPIKSTVGYFQDASANYLGCLQDVLENERDLRELCLTSKREARLEAGQGAGAEAGAGASGEARAATVTVGSTRSWRGDSNRETRIEKGSRKARVDSTAGAQLKPADRAVPGPSTEQQAQPSERRAGVGAGASSSQHPDPVEASPPASPTREPKETLAVTARPRPHTHSSHSLEQEDSPAWRVPRQEDSPAWRVPRQEDSPAWRVPRQEDSPAWRVPRQDVDQAELLLEAYFQLMQLVQQDATKMRRSIESKQELVNMQLDQYRNHLIEVDLRVNFLGTGFALGSFAGSIFGMNLVSGLEDQPMVFWGVAGATGLLVMVMYRSLAAYTQATSPGGRHAARVMEFLQQLSRGQARQAAASAASAQASEGAGGDGDATASREAQKRQEEQQTLLQRLADRLDGGPLARFASRLGLSRRSSGLVDLMRAQQQVKLTKEQFAAVYRAAVGREIGHDELEFTFRLMDGDNDNRLGVDEILGVISAHQELSEASRQGGLGYRTIGADGLAASLEDATGTGTGPRLGRQSNREDGGDSASSGAGEGGEGDSDDEPWRR